MNIMCATDLGDIPVPLGVPSDTNNHVLSSVIYFAP